LSPIIDGLELATIDRHAIAFQRADPAAEFYELRTGLADRRSVIMTEIRNRLVIRHQPPEQPHQLDIATRLTFQPAAGGDAIEIAINEQLQRHRRMVTGPTCPRMGRAREAKVHQIKLVDKQIHHTNQVILVDPVLKTVRKQRHLISINTFDKA
jgi:hypothetical protein